VVAALAVIGIAVVGLVGALGISFHLSGIDRVDSIGDLLVVRYAEALAAVPYEPCGAGGTPYIGAALAAIPSTGLPAGVTAGAWGSAGGSPRAFEFEVESVGFWNGDANAPVFGSTCSAADHGAGELRLRVRSGDGAFDRNVTIVKRAG
jgi:hypothetical protein